MVRKDAEDFNLIPIDATCPLVTKVHNQVNKLGDKEFNIVMIGLINETKCNILLIT